MQGSETKPDDRTLALLQEAREAMRFEGEALWRAEEFFAGIVASLLAVAAAIWGLAPGRLTVRTVGLSAAAAAAVAAVLALVGQRALAHGSYFFLKHRLARNLLLRRITEGHVLTQQDLEKVRRLLTEPVTKAKELYEQDLDADEQGELRRALFGRRGVRWGFRLVLWILAFVALVGAVASLLLAFSILPLALGAADLLGIGSPIMFVFVVVWWLHLGLPRELRSLPREPFHLRALLSGIVRFLRKS